MAHNHGLQIHQQENYAIYFSEEYIMKASKQTSGFNKQVNIEIVLHTR